MKKLQKILECTIALGLVTVFVSCTSDKQQEQKEVVLPEKNAVPISMDEVTGNQPPEENQTNGKATKTKKSKKKKKKSAGKKGKKSKGTAYKGMSPAAKKQCLSLIERIVVPYKTLYAKLDKNTYISNNSALDQMVQLTPSVCDQVVSYKAASALMNKATAEHSGKLGIILPLTGKNNEIISYMVKGMRAAFSERQRNFEAETVLKDSATKNPETLLAELVFKDKVAMITGGFDDPEAQVLAKWSELLMLPVVITNHDREVGGLSRYTYMLYPDEMRLAYTLAAEAERRNLKRIAILKPSNHKSDRLIDFFKQALAAQGGQVAYDLVYTPQNFDSMQAVSRTMFKIDSNERADEYRAAYWRARRNAKAQGVPFDPRMVVLKPIVNFDAILIPDDFRTVRHFAKLFKFHQVDKLTLFGNHEWRSPALVEPYDEFLEGSFFADFLGSYAKLPPSISAPTVGSPYFVQPQSVLAVDFQLIGYRVGRVGSLVCDQKTVSRRHLPAKINAISSNSSSFFGNGLVFEKDHQSNWPTYIFGIANGGLQMEKEHTQLNLPGQTQKAQPSTNLGMNK